MLRFKADRKSLIYMFITTALLFIQWNYTGFNIFIWGFALFMGVTVAVMTHNHNHLPMWKNKQLNILTDLWLTVFYGFPVFAWIPTHNKNHHRLNNREGDYTITYRVSEKNNLLTLISYPTISSYYQQKAIAIYLKEQWAKDKEKFFLSILQYVFLGAWLAFFFILDWKKALLYIFIPQQFALFSVLAFNYVQHVHANEESKYNHSRNFVGALNWFLFNNGLHTVHHDRAGLHWSEVPAAHAKVKDKIDPVLLEQSFWWYIFRVYVLGIFMKKYRTNSQRLERMAAENSKNSANTNADVRMNNDKMELTHA